MMNHLKLALIFSFSITLIASKVVADDSHIGEGVQSLPIFDAHIHYKEPAWGPYPPKTIIEMMNKSGVAMGLVSSTLLISMQN